MAEQLAFAPSLALRGGTLAGASLPVSGRPSASPVPARARTTPRMAFTSIGGVLTDAPVSVPCDAATAVASVYRQVLGNAHFMESERAELAAFESDFLMSGDVREFVRAIAKSDAYISRFVEPVSAFRTTELMFKHLLGRAARSKAEYAQAMGVMQKSGHAAAVDWFVDSDEYEEAFGAGTVPYGVFRGLYPTNEEFNRAVAMRGTPSSSDKGRSSMLAGAVCSGDSPSWLRISQGLPAGTEKGTGFSPASRWASGKRNKNAPTRISTKIPGGVIIY